MKISEKEAVSPVIGVILMVAITVVLAAVLYVWVSGFMTTTTGGVYALSTSAWTQTGTSINASVISTTPTAGIRAVDITWQSYNTATGVTASLTVSVYSVGTTSADMVRAGYRLQTTAPTAGTYTVRAVVGGSQVYESASFTTT